MSEEIKELSSEELYNLSDEDLQNEINKLRETSSEEVSEETPISSDNSEEVIEESTSEGSEEPVEPIGPSTYRVKANGQEYDFTLEELQKLAPKALDYTKKMQNIAPYRKTITAMEENGISQADLNLLIDIKKGNKEAIGSLLKQMNIDPLDVNTEEVNYAPNDYGIDDSTYKLNQVFTELESDETFETTKNVMKVLDNDSKKLLTENPDLIYDLNDDIKSGIFHKIKPMADKLGALDGYKNSYLTYYFHAGTEFLKQEEALKKSKIEQDRLKQQEVTRAKQNAGIPSNKPKNSLNNVIQYAHEISDEDYQAWLKERGLN